MALFENDAYEWRETYFVLFEAKRCPTVGQMQELADGFSDRYRLSDLRGAAAGDFESLTLESPADLAGMDVTLVRGEDAGIAELLQQLGPPLSPEDARKIAAARRCDARFEVYHFERVEDVEQGDELDPGSLLDVLAQLTALCGGVGIDPQSGTFL